MREYSTESMRNSTSAHEEKDAAFRQTVSDQLNDIGQKLNAAVKKDILILKNEKAAEEKATPETDGEN